MSKVSHPLGEWFASVLSQLLLVCRFCLCNWDTVTIQSNQGVSMQPLCYWFYPALINWPEYKFSSDWWLPGVTVSNPGRVSIFLVWNPLKPDWRLVLMYSLEQRMTASCLVFSGEFFTCTGCWRQPGSWGGSQSLNNCTVMRKRTSSVFRQSQSNHPFTHSQDVVKWSASWLIRPLVFSLGRVGIGGRGGGLKPQLPDELRFSFVFLLKSRSRSSRMSLPFSLLLHPVTVYLSTNANKPPPLANV